VASTPVYSDQVYGNCMLDRGYALLRLHLKTLPCGRG
jgi:hypothetical protein